MTAATRNRARTRFAFVAVSLFAVLMALVVNVPTYRAYFSGKFPIAGVVNLHALLMGSWLGIFLIQAVLASTGRLALHRKVGSFAIPLGVLVWTSMVFVEIRAMVVNPPTADRDLDWLLPGVYCYTSFGLFFGAAVWLRHKPDWHKRLMVFAMFVALQAVEQRMYWLPHSSANYWTDFAYVDACLFVPLIAFDWVSLRHIHPATTTAGAVLLSTQAAALLAWGTAGWHQVAGRAVQLVGVVF